jgi:DNA-binding transcriptional ArsR family regulator
MPRDLRTKQPVKAITNAVNHDLRLEIITILHQGEFSAGEIADMLDEDVRYVTGHVHILMATGCIEFVGFRRIGGHPRAVFRAITLPVVTDEVFRKMTKEERHDGSGAIVQGFVAESLSALANEKLDSAEEPPCLIWDAPPLDAKRREKLRKRLTEVWVEEVLAAEAETVNAVSEPGEEAVPTVVGLFCFERGRRGRPESGYYRAQKP